MPNEISVPTWKQCEVLLRQIQHDYSDSATGVLFRGHTNAEWRLDTTLERRMGGPTSFIEYYRLIGRIRTSVETFTNSAWEFPKWDTIDEWVNSTQHKPGD